MQRPLIIALALTLLIGFGVFLALTSTPDGTETAVPAASPERTLPTFALEFSSPGGLYTEPLSLSMASQVPEAVIYYTLDGGEPTTKSLKYTSPLEIADRTGEANKLTNYTNIYDDRVYKGYTVPSDNLFKGTVVKARAYTADGMPVSETVTGSYFIHPYILTRYNLPIISLVTEADGLFGNENGIYVDGGDPWNSPNWDNKGIEWERPVHMELFETDGRAAVSMDMGLRLNGGATRRIPQKAFRLYARSEYGADNKAVKYDVFQGLAEDVDGNAITRFKRLLLRNSGNEGTSTMFRDALLQELSSGLKVDTQACRPAAVFINGEFWGLYNIRERLDNEYLESHYKVDKNNVTILEMSPNGGKPTISEGVEGDDAAYYELHDFFENNSLTGAENYQKAQSYIDIDSFIDYYSAQIYLGNIDWPGNNVKMWRNKVDYDDAANVPYGHDGRWRWMIFDLDSSTGFDFGFKHNQDNFARLLRGPESEGENWQSPGWSTLFFRRLIENEEFKEKFVNRFCDIMNTTYHHQPFTALVDKYADRVRAIMPEHIARFSYINSMEVWENNLLALKDFALNRQYYMLIFLKDNLQLPDAVTLTAATDAAKGRVIVNEITIDPERTKGVESAGEWSGTYFVGTRQTIAAKAAEGFTFSKFIVTQDTGAAEYTANPLTIALTSDTTVTAVFSTGEASDTLIAAVELMGLLVPASGATPIGADALGTNGGKYSVTSLVWSPARASFDFDTSYTALITLQAQPGYTFAAGLTPSVGAGAVSPCEISSNGTILTFSVAFTATAVPTQPPLVLAVACDLLRDVPWTSGEIACEPEEDKMRLKMLSGGAWITIPLNVTVNVDDYENLYMELTGFPEHSEWNLELDYVDSTGFANTISAKHDYMPEGRLGSYSGEMFLLGHFLYQKEHWYADIDIYSVKFTELRFYSSAPAGTEFTLNKLLIGEYK